MKRDAKLLFSLFTVDPADIKQGDLVITGEIHRVTNRSWGKSSCMADEAMSVTTIKPGEPESPYCHIMSPGYGQQNVMKLVGIDSLLQLHRLASRLKRESKMMKGKARQNRARIPSTCERMEIRADERDCIADEILEMLKGGR